MTTIDKIRESVSRTYTKAVRGGGGCCVPTCCDDAIAIPKGETAKVAGYGDDELGSLPADAVENAFGCGNPLAFSGVQEGDVVVDLGSGAGIDLLLASERVGASGKVIGVDMTDAMIERARANVAEAGADNVEVRKGFIEDLPIEDCSVDWVISNCVINLSPEKSRVFAEIARVLKPGGRASISDIVVEDLPDDLRKLQSLYDSCIAGSIDESSYLDGLAAAGLTDVEVTDRLVYERDQIARLLGTELPEPLRGFADSIADRVAGKVWSAKVKAVKPD
jgi:SAM-dependent methyltransferase